MRKALVLAVLMAVWTPTVFGQAAIREEAAGWAIRAGPLVVELDRDAARVVSVRVGGKRLASGTGGVHLYDGKTRKAVGSLVAAESGVVGTHESPALRVGWAAADGALKGRHEVHPEASGIRWRVTVENAGDQPQWLEVRLGLPIDPQRGWQYWDGRNAPVKVEPNSRILSGRAAPVLPDDGCARGPAHYGLDFPLNCVWTDDAGLAVGVEPHALRSYFAGGAEPGLSAADAFYYATKMVIDPAKSETVTFLVFAFDPAYGFRGALERYYEQFPDAYRHDPQTDSRLLSHCAVAGTAVLFQGQPFLWEDSRRLGLGWTWGTNARYGGACYPEDARQQSEKERKDSYWSFKHPNYKKPSWVKKAVEERGGLTAEEHRRYVREAFDGAADALAVAFDMTTQYCDRELAEREFADSIFLRADGKPVMVPNWPHHIMYAWGTRFGETHSRLVREAVSALQPAGVHLDNAVGYDPHYGAGVAESPGRAFDLRNGKLYSFEGIGQAMQMAAAREFRVRGQRVFVAANTVGTYFGARLCDVSLIESLGPWQGEGERWRGKQTQPGFEHYMALRFLLGSKPLVFCGPYPWEVKVEKGTPQPEWVKAYEALARDYPLFAYRVGAPSISYVLRVCANVRQHSDTILKLCRAGWHPVAGARADTPSLWVERFGRGVGAFITLGNPTDAPVQARIRFDPKPWGGPVAVTTADGEPLKAMVERGASNVTASVAARSPVAWRVVARVGLQPALDGTALEATADDESTRIVLDCPRTCAADIAALIPEEHAYESVLVNGQRHTAHPTPGGVAVDDARLPAGKSVIEIRHPNEYRIAPEAADFPFFKDERRCSAIVLRKDASASERVAAEHLSRYFQFHLAHRQRPLDRPDMLWQIAKDEHQIPVVEADKVPADANLILIGQPTLPELAAVVVPVAPRPPLRGLAQVARTSDGRQVLVLRASAPGSLDSALRALLKTLDARYPF